MLAPVVMLSSSAFHPRAIPMMETTYQEPLRARPTLSPTYWVMMAKIVPMKIPKATFPQSQAFLSKLSTLFFSSRYSSRIPEFMLFHMSVSR